MMKGNYRKAKTTIRLTKKTFDAAKSADPSGQKDEEAIYKEFLTAAGSDAEVLLAAGVLAATRGATSRAKQVGAVPMGNKSVNDLLRVQIFEIHAELINMAIEFVNEMIAKDNATLTDPKDRAAPVALAKIEEDGVTIASIPEADVARLFVRNFQQVSNYVDEKTRFTAYETICLYQGGVFLSTKDKNWCHHALVAAYIRAGTDLISGIKNKDKNLLMQGRAGFDKANSLSRQYADIENIGKVKTRVIELAKAGFKNRLGTGLISLSDLDIQEKDQFYYAAAGILLEANKGDGGRARKGKDKKVGTGTIEEMIEKGGVAKKAKKVVKKAAEADSDGDDAVSNLLGALTKAANKSKAKKKK
jgi:hypothetical protein